MQNRIAIVVVAYNRPKPLERLLESIKKANFGGNKNIPLIISIDYSEKEDCLNVANDFNWAYGPKEVIFHPKRLGLKEHVLSCGDISSRFDGVILLEDDLIVSPNFYNYIIQADSFFEFDDRIAGIALYSYRYNEFSGLPFEALDDGYDNYFMQVPCSWGQFWSKKQWSGFSTFLESPYSQITLGDTLPEDVIKNWPNNSSWKRLFYKYLVSKSIYFVYPRIALCTNMGYQGTHHSSDSNIHQTPVLMGERKFNFSNLEYSLSVYDYLFELSPNALKRLVPSLESMNVECDLHGQKRLNKVKSTFLISIKPVSKDPIKTFGSQIFPGELNIPFETEGDFYSLALTSSFTEVTPLEKLALKARGEIRCSESLLDFFPKREAFREGMNLVRKSLTYRVGNILLSPIKKVVHYFKK